MDDDGTKRLTDEDLRHMDELSACPCAYCSSYCVTYEDLYSCRRRKKWKRDMDRKYRKREE